MTTTNRTIKAVKAGRLAISAELLGNEGEATQAALTCGRLARAAGMGIDDVSNAIDGIAGSALAWYYVVDGWYEAGRAA